MPSPRAIELATRAQKALFGPFGPKTQQAQIADLAWWMDEALNDACNEIKDELRKVAVNAIEAPLSRDPEKQP
jgi:hypothetical protein